MRKLFSGLALLISFLAMVEAKAHGEDKPGPNGGQIRMPGPYHTEALTKGDGFQIFLLDLDFKNPMTANSSVKAILDVSGRKIQLTCEAHTDHFFCPSKENLKSGVLLIESTRNSARGNTAKYQLPI
jgi:hypothetical protein